MFCVIYLFIILAISFPGSKYFRLTGSGVDGIDRGLTIRLSSFGVLLAGGPLFPLFTSLGCQWSLVRFC